MAATLMVTSAATAEEVAAEDAVLDAVELAAPPQAARLSAAAPTPATFRKLRREDVYKRQGYGIAEQQIYFIKGQCIEKQRFFQAGIFSHTICQLMDACRLNPGKLCHILLQKAFECQLSHGLHLSTYS